MFKLLLKAGSVQSLEIALNLFFFLRQYLQVKQNILQGQEICPTREVVGIVGNLQRISHSWVGDLYHVMMALTRAGSAYKKRHQFRY